MLAFISILFLLLAAYSVCHYALSTFWRNPIAVIIVSTVFSMICIVVGVAFGTSLAGSLAR